MLEQSKTLRVLIRGEWKDSLERKIVLEAWDPETVGRLLEWLWTGDYESPIPTETAKPDANSSEIDVPKTSVPPSPDEKEPQSTRKKSAKGSQQPLTPLETLAFSKAYPERAPSHAEALTQWAAYFKQSSCVLNFEATLLAHAKLYALADYMLLPALQAHVFQRLRAVLIFIVRPTYPHAVFMERNSLPIANTQVIDNIIALIQYVYANTTQLESEEEPLRELISTFLALHYDQFVDKGGQVLRFMEQGEDFQGDVHDKVRRNEVSLKKELMAVKEEL